MMVPQMKKAEEENNSKKFVGTSWSSILMSNNKSMEEETLMNCIVKPPIPYVAKTKKTSLSDKSLQICTESLGSETGSDHLLFSSSSSYTIPSWVQTQFQAQTQALPEEHCVNNNLVVMNKCTPRCSSPPSSFPPPLPSLGTLSRRRDGNGRLFLEALPAVAAASHKNDNNKNKLCAQRQDGRLVLTFAPSKEEEEEVEEFEEDDNVVVDEEEEYDDEDDLIEEANHDDDDHDDDDYDHFLVHHHNNNSKSIISCKDSRRSFLLWEPHCIATTS